MDRQNEGSEDPPQGGWSCWTWEVSCHIGMGIHRSHLKRIVMTLYLVYPLLLYICPVWGKDHSITVILFNDRYQKVLNLLKKTLDYMERSLFSDYNVNVQKVSKQADSQACQSRLKVNYWKKLNFFETFWKKLLTMCTPDDIIYKSPR